MSSVVPNNTKNLPVRVKHKNQIFKKYLLDLLQYLQKTAKRTCQYRKRSFTANLADPTKNTAYVPKKIGFHRVNQKVNIRFKNPKFPNSNYYISAIVIPMRETSLKNVLLTENSTI